MDPLEKVLIPPPFRCTLSDGTELLVPVRISSRCRRLSLRSVKSGFELVIPPGIDPRLSYDFCSKNLDWIEKVRRKRAKFEATHPQQKKVLPAEIFFPFTGELFSVEYVPEDVVWAGVRRSGNRLIVSGKVASFEQGSAALRRWLIRYAEENLLPYAGAIAKNHGFSGITKFRTGIQKRSWGTCTRSGVITLNASLLFFTKHQAEYVILHEFCHLTELNHSSRFWNLLESVYPGAKEARESLKYAQQDLPVWLSAD